MLFPSAVKHEHLQPTLTCTANSDRQKKKKKKGNAKKWCVNYARIKNTVVGKPWKQPGGNLNLGYAVIQ